MAKRKKGWGNAGKAATFLIAFLGIGFFATALDRFMGWNAERSGWKSGAVTLGATLIAFVGLRAMKQGSWANSAMVAGLTMAGFQVVVKPVTEAGVKLADYLRSAAKQPQLAAPQTQSPSTSSFTQQSPSSPGITGAVPTGMGPASPTAGVTGGTAPATSTQASAPAGAVYHITQEAAKPPSLTQSIIGAVAQLGSAAITGAFGGSKGAPNDMMALGAIR